MAINFELPTNLNKKQQKQDIYCTKMNGNICNLFFMS